MISVQHLFDPATQPNHFPCYSPFYTEFGADAAAAAAVFPKCRSRISEFTERKTISGWPSDYEKWMVWVEFKFFFHLSTSTGCRSSSVGAKCRPPPLYLRR